MCLRSSRGSRVSTRTSSTMWLMTTMASTHSLMNTLPLSPTFSALTLTTHLGKRLATASSDHTIRIWEQGEGGEVCVLLSLLSSICSLFSYPISYPLLTALLSAPLLHVISMHPSLLYLIPESISALLNLLILCSKQKITSYPINFATLLNNYQISLLVDRLGAH
jgi:WD40 repeat protein